MQPNQPKIVGRGSQIDPPNRFERVRTVSDLEQLDPTELSALEAGTTDDRKIPTQFFPDITRSIITENDSPDIGFRFSINPYRGCEHGCAYCYARPGHEYLGLSGGLDFETKIFVKHDAAALLRAELNHRKWRGDEAISISGVTDCYQPAEREYKLTRGLLDVCLEARQAVGIISKNALVTRDIDLLSQLAKLRLVHVFLSVTTLDADLARTLEPRTSPPVRRLAAVRQLTDAGVPVGVMMAPIVPGLTDTEIPAVLKAAGAAGAITAGWTMLRLPYAVRPVFENWLTYHQPDHAERVLGKIRAMRGGKLNDSEFGRRMVGEGHYAENIQRTFAVFKKKFGLGGRMPQHDFSLFQPPRSSSGQLRMF